MNILNLNQQLKSLTNDQAYSELSNVILEALRFNSIKFTPDHAKLVFNNSIGMLRKFFADFTINDLIIGFQNGCYGEYGEYKDVSTKVIMNWMNKRRFEIHNKETQANYARNQEIPAIFCQEGGRAVILGMALRKMDIDLDFDERLDIIHNNKPIPGINRSSKEVISRYEKSLMVKGI